MSQQVAATESADGRWKTLYRIGAIAPLVTMAAYVSEIVLVDWEAFPTTTHEWYQLFEQSRPLAFFYLNGLDMFSIALLGPMFLALCVALRRQNVSWVVVVGFFASLGIGVFVALRAPMLALLPLSDRYAAAVTEAEQTLLLTVGEALGAPWQATFQTVGFLFIALAVLILSLVMVRSPRFAKVTSYVGIGAGALVVADFVCLFLLPSLADPLMYAGMLFWFVWWIMVSVGLFRLSRGGGSRAG